MIVAMTELEWRYQVAIDSIGWFFLWPISMIVNMHWQSFSDFMQAHGWEYIGYGEWWRVIDSPSPSSKRTLS